MQYFIQGALEVIGDVLFIVFIIIVIGALFG